LFIQFLELKKFGTRAHTCFILECGLVGGGEFEDLDDSDSFDEECEATRTFLLPHEIFFANLRAFSSINYTSMDVSI
jgi:hypothetical protein